MKNSITPYSPIAVHEALNMCSDKLPLEDRLLVHCARGEISPPIACQIGEMIYSGPNWEYFVNQCLRHRVAPLAYQNLRRFREEGVPEDVLEKLREYQYMTVLQNMFIYAELRSILRRMDAAGIPVICLKGAALAQTVYRNPSLRPIADIDILVKKRDVDNAHHMLLQYGYRVAYPVITEENTDLVGHLPPYLKPKPGGGMFMLEVRDDLSSALGILGGWRMDPDDVWKKAIAFDFNGRRAWTLAPEHLILYLSLHAAKHLYNLSPLMIWWCDIAEAQRRYNGDIDWGFVVETAKESGVEEYLYQSLLFTHAFLNAPVPLRYLEGLRPSYLLVPLQDVMECIVKGDSDKLHVYGYNHLSFVASLTGMQRKIVYLIKNLFPNRVSLLTRYSATAGDSVWRCLLAHIWRYIVLGIRSLCQLLKVYLPLSGKAELKVRKPSR